MSATASLSERYVHAVTRRLPEEQRADVADELRASIADRVESILDERPGTSVADAEREALTELGDPDAMSGAYTGRRMQLLGPAVYPAWERAVKAILVVAVPTAMLATAVIGAATGESLGEVLGSTAWFGLTLTVHVLFWTTLAFVVAERSGPDVRASLDVPWRPESLPDVTRDRGSLPDLVATLTFLALFGGLLVWQQVRPPLTLDGQDVPVLDPDLWSSWLPLVLVLLVVEGAFEVVKYLAGGWTRAMAVANVALGAIFAAPFVALGLTERLLDPRAVEVVQREWSGFSPDAAHLVVVLAAVGIWLWDSVDGFVKQHRAGERGRDDHR